VCGEAGPWPKPCRRRLPGARCPRARRRAEAARGARAQELGLAVQSLGVLLTQQAGASREVARCRLVLAGGYDARLAENREVLQGLRDLVADLGLGDQARAWVPSAARVLMPRPRPAPLRACGAGQARCACWRAPCVHV